jgi:transcriptional regulator with XRE-family HTH domain
MNKTFSHKLRELRGTMSQTEFCTKIGCKQTSYSGWETGDREPSASAVALICNGCGVTADWLLGIDAQAVTPRKEKDLNAKINVLRHDALEASNSIEKLLVSIKKLEGAL